MLEILSKSELLEGLPAAHVERLIRIAKRQTLEAGEYLFLLSDVANRLFVVVEGRIEVCFPLSIDGAMKDVAVEVRTPGSTLGWSALVKPHRFTLSARAAAPSTVMAFPRTELTRLMDEDCALGKALLGRIAEISGRRLLTMQALWARELQRSLVGGRALRPDPRPS
jgi:CRP-like cAMP-binding protein